MKTHLFNKIFLTSEAKIQKGCVELQTPMGKAVFDIHFLDYFLSSLEHELFTLSNGILLRRWETDVFIIEVLTIPFESKSLEFPTDGNRAQVIRIYFKKNVPHLTFKAILQGEDPSCESNPDCGENLEALTFESLKGALTLGTEDSDALNARAYQNDWIPKRWNKFFGYTVDNKINPFEFLPEGIVTTLPEIYAYESLQISYIISWVNQLQNSFNARITCDASIKNIFKLVGLEY